MIITVTLTETEYKALQYAAFDPQDWLDNAAHERCRIAIDEIAKICFEQCLANNIQIPGSKEAMVDLAFENDWIKTVAQKNAEALANIPEE